MRILFVADCSKFEGEVLLGSRMIASSRGPSFFFFGIIERSVAAASCPYIRHSSETRCVSESTVRGCRVNCCHMSGHASESSKTPPLLVLPSLDQDHHSSLVHLSRWHHTAD